MSQLKRLLLSLTYLTTIRASIESILRYGVASWFGNLAVIFKSQITRLVKTAGKIMGRSSPPSNLQTMFDQEVMRLARNIISDPLHVLNSEYKFMRTERRYRGLLCKYNRYKRSFVPLSIKLLNDNGI